MVNATKSGQIIDYTVMSLNKQLIKRLNLSKVQTDMKLINCTCSQVHNLVLYVLLLDEKEDEIEPEEELDIVETVTRKVNVLVDVTETGQVLDFNVNLGNFTLKKLNATRVTDCTKLANCTSCAQAFEIILYFCVVDKDEILDDFGDENDQVEVKFNITNEELKDDINFPKDRAIILTDYADVSVIETDSTHSSFVVEENQLHDETLTLNEASTVLKYKVTEREEVEMIEERLEEEEIEQAWEIIEEQNSQDFTSQAFSRVPPIPNFNFSTLPDSSNEALVPETISSPTVLTCTCNQQFTDALALYKHQRYCEIGKLEVATCCICATTFKFWQSLINHIKNIHGTKKYACSICGARERTQSEFQQHLLRHEDSKPFKCDSCPAAFSKKQSLKLHIRREHDVNFDAYLCEQCPEKKFASAYLLKKHQNDVHCTERSYQCNECDKFFKTRAHLKNHMNNLHHKVEVITDGSYEEIRTFFECEICLKCFTAKSSLIRHQMIHTGQKPYVCHCGKAFRSSDELKSHLRLVWKYFTVFRVPNFINFSYIFLEYIPVTDRISVVFA